MSPYCPPWFIYYFSWRIFYFYVSHYFQMLMSWRSWHQMQIEDVWTMIKCGCHDLLNSKMISMRRTLYFIMEDIFLWWGGYFIFTVLLMSSIVLPLSSNVFPVSSWSVTCWWCPPWSSARWSCPPLLIMLFVYLIWFPCCYIYEVC